MTQEIPEEGYILFIDGERVRKVYRTIAHAKCALRAQRSKFDRAVIARLVVEDYKTFVPKYENKGAYNETYSLLEVNDD